MYHGIINVYKEAGFTSHDVVAKLRGICKQKRIGHTGTLDPDAVGVLPVCLGNGTRLCDMLTDRQKEYIAVFRLGLVTDTQDISGRVLEEKEAFVSAEEVKGVIASFTGEIMQVPPMYSALKVNGKKLCDLARAGKEVERAPRPVTIYAIELLEENHPDYTIRVSCSKGTYIRTLCHDMGQALGCGGVMTALKRTRAGEFKAEDAYSLEKLQFLADEGRLLEAVIPVEEMFRKLPAIQVREEAFKALRNGNQLSMGLWTDTDREAGRNQKAGTSREAGRNQKAGTSREPGEELEAGTGQEFRVYSHEGVFYGVYRYDGERGLLVPVKMFLPEG